MIDFGYVCLMSSEHLRSIENCCRRFFFICLHVSSLYFLWYSSYWLILFEYVSDLKIACFLVWSFISSSISKSLY